MLTSPTSRLASPLRVALGEYDTGWHDPAGSLARAREVAQSARAAGCGLLVLPEMCTTGFTMECANYAEPLTGPSVRELARIAADNEIWLIAGVPVSRNGGFVNSALAFRADGSIAAEYEKQKLFGYADETSHYRAGTGNCILDIGELRVALFICFDLRFPEIFRAAGPRVDAFIIIANWPETRQRHWEVLTRARAIENRVFVIAVNRSGSGGGLAYEGGSLALDPWGERCDTATGNGALRVAEISRPVVDSIRENFPWEPDRRR